MSLDEHSKYYTISQQTFLASLHPVRFYSSIGGPTLTAFFVGQSSKMTKLVSFCKHQLLFFLSRQFLELTIQISDSFLSQSQHKNSKCQRKFWHYFLQQQRNSVQYLDIRAPIDQLKDLNTSIGLSASRKHGIHQGVIQIC